MTDSNSFISFTLEDKNKEIITKDRGKIRL